MHRFWKQLALALAALAPLPASQALVKDIDTRVLGEASSSPSDLKAVGSHVLFSAAGTTSRLLWRTDGTAAGTQFVHGTPPVLMAHLRGDIAIYASLSGERASSTFSLLTDLHRTNGTAAGSWVLPLSKGITEALVQVAGEVVILHRPDRAPGTPSTEGMLEIWSTDGSIQGTRLLATFLSRDFPPRTAQLSAVGPAIYASFNDKSGQERLWHAPNTSAPFQQLTAPRLPRDLTPLGERLIFSGSQSATGTELWTTDGTAAGTTPIDIVPGAASSAPRGFFVHGSRAYFTASDAATGREPWVTDGMPGGTRMVSDLVPGKSSSNPVFIGTVGSEVITHANDGIDDMLYAIDANGTARLLSSGSVKAREGGALVGGQLVFSGASQAGQELWITDGTASGTRQLADINPGPNDSSPSELVAFGGRVLFSAVGPDGDEELWTTDGTMNGTGELVDLLPGAVPVSSGPALVGKLGDTAILVATDEAGGRELWSSDGTSAGTHRIIDLQPGPASSSLGSFTFADDYFVFTSVTPTTSRLFSSDGTEAGTQEVGPGARYEGTQLGKQVVYGTGGDISITDGTAAGTQVLRSFGPQQTVGIETERLGDHVYFAARTPNNNQGVWRTDGTVAGTELFWDPQPAGSQGFYATNGFTQFRNELYFYALRSSDLELWATDGTLNGLRRVGAIAPRNGLSSSRMIASAGHLFFLQRTDTQEATLFSSDGLASITALASLPNIPTFFEATANGVVFDHSFGELWASNGQANGTYAIADFDTDELNSVSSMGSPGATTTVLRVRSLTESEYWVTDGRGVGTRAVGTGLPFAPASSSMPIGSSVRIGSKVLFTNNDPLVGAELFSHALSDFGDFAQETYGTSCGSNLTIGLAGEPRASSSAPFAVTLEGAPSNAAGWLFSSPERAYANLGGCFIGLGGSLRATPIQTDASGEASVSFAPSPAIVDLRADFQFAVLDAQGGYRGFSISPALEIVGGP